MEEEVRGKNKRRKTGFFFFFSGNVPCKLCFLSRFFSRPTTCHQQTHTDFTREKHTVSLRGTHTQSYIKSHRYSHRSRHTAMSVQCKHMQTQTSPVNSSCTCMDKQLYSTLLQTPSSTHLNKVSFCFYLWDLTTSSSDGPPPPPSPTHGVLRLPVQPSPQPTEAP